MMNRRAFLRASIVGIGTATVLSSIGLPAFAASRSSVVSLSAMDDAQGRHFIAGINRQGAIVYRLPVPEQGHGGCRRPFADEVVMFSKRPGHSFQVIDFRAGRIIQQVDTVKDHHFYGHGSFSPDGDLLYVTANHYPSGGGRILVYDASRDYQRVGNFELDGIGPHEIRLHPDGNALVVALGGILTHPDYDRLKLNIPDMQPALLLIDRESGRILQRHEPSHHQLSCRHLDVSKEGIVVAGYQFEGPEWETPPLIARLDTRTATFAEIVLPDKQQERLHNYIASVALDSTSHIAALTAPRGNRAILLNYLSGQHIDTVEIADVAGALTDQQQGFIFTSGLGGIYRSRQSNAVRIENSEMLWDNHLTST